MCVLFLGGVQLISIGILGEYIGRIYEEIKQRPLYVVQEKLGIGDPPDVNDTASRRRRRPLNHLSLTRHQAKARMFAP